MSIGSPPAHDIEWLCTPKDRGVDTLCRRNGWAPALVVTARTAFAAGKIAEQSFKCHWSDLDVIPKPDVLPPVRCK